MVHAGAGSAGLEWRATPKSAFAVYYGADYFGQNFFPDTTDAANPGKIIGFGGPGSPTPTTGYPAGHLRLDQYVLAESQARSAAGLHTVLLLDARPLVCRSGTPRNAHLSMVYMGLRYVLPTTSGTLAKVPRPD